MQTRRPVQSHSSDGVFLAVWIRPGFPYAHCAFIFPPIIFVETPPLPRPTTTVTSTSGSASARSPVQMNVRLLLGLLTWSAATTALANGATYHLQSSVSKDTYKSGNGAREIPAHIQEVVTNYRVAADARAYPLGGRKADSSAFKSESAPSCSPVSVGSSATPPTPSTLPSLREPPVMETATDRFSSRCIRQRSRGATRDCVIPTDPHVPSTGSTACRSRRRCTRRLWIAYVPTASTCLKRCRR